VKFLGSLKSGMFANFYHYGPQEHYYATR